MTGAMPGADGNVKALGTAAMPVFRPDSWTAWPPAICVPAATRPWVPKRHRQAPTTVMAETRGSPWRRPTPATTRGFAAMAAGLAPERERQIKYRWTDNLHRRRSHGARRMDTVRGRGIPRRDRPALHRRGQRASRLSPARRKPARSARRLRPGRCRPTTVSNGAATFALRRRPRPRQ